MDWKVMSLKTVPTTVCERKQAVVLYCIFESLDFFNICCMATIHQLKVII